MSIDREQSSLEPLHTMVEVYESWTITLYEEHPRIVDTIDILGMTLWTRKSWEPPRISLKYHPNPKQYESANVGAVERATYDKTRKQFHRAYDEDMELRLSKTNRLVQEQLYLLINERMTGHCWRLAIFLEVPGGQMTNVHNARRRHNEKRTITEYRLLLRGRQEI